MIVNLETYIGLESVGGISVISLDYNSNQVYNTVSVYNGYNVVAGLAYKLIRGVSISVDATTVGYVPNRTRVIEDQFNIFGVKEPGVFDYVILITHLIYGDVDIETAYGISMFKGLLSNTNTNSIISTSGKYKFDLLTDINFKSSISKHIYFEHNDEISITDILSNLIVKVLQSDANLDTVLYNKIYVYSNNNDYIELSDYIEQQTDIKYGTVGLTQLAYPSGGGSYIGNSNLIG